MRGNVARPPTRSVEKNYRSSPGRWRGVWVGFMRRPQFANYAAVISSVERRRRWPRNRNGWWRNPDRTSSQATQTPFWTIR